MELSKKDKKVARDVIELGLQREIESGLSKADAILQAWKTKAKDNKETYHQLYKHIITLDKHIARRYDDITGSRYLLTIIGQMRDNVIHDEDLIEFSEEVQLYLIGIIKSF
ncbi:MAG: hypothetical protein WCK78_04465 [Paludibacter sp.]